METLVMDGLRKACQGLISLQEVRRVTADLQPARSFGGWRLGVGGWGLTVGPDSLTTRCDHLSYLR